MLTREKKLMKEDVVLVDLIRTIMNPKDYGQRLLMVLWCRFPLYIEKVLYRMESSSFTLCIWIIWYINRSWIQISYPESS